MLVYFYFPHCPLPATSGAHHRAIQVISGLVKRGDDVVFLSSDIHSENPWDRQAIESVLSLGCRDVKIYRADWFDRCYLLAKQTWNRIPGNYDVFDNAIEVPPRLANWFKREATLNRPELIVVSYCWFSRLIEGLGSNSLTVCDNHGLFSINHAMEDWIAKQLEQLRHSNEVDDRFWSIDLVNTLKFQVRENELRRYRPFDRIIALSPRERDILTQELPSCSIDYLPLTFQANTGRSPAHNGKPVAVVGPNQFNEHGLETFGAKVMPMLQRAKSDFELSVIGKAALKCRTYRGMNYLGYVDDLISIYLNAGFCICTTSAGTGQQVKIIEAMSMGLPVVAPSAAAKGTLLIDKENSLVVDSYEAFADAILTLASDLNAQKRLGTNAREAVASQYTKCGDISACVGF